MSLFSSGTTSMNATGGDTIQTIGGYRIHTFTTVGSATFTPNMAGSVDVLVVAGGGGSGGGIGGAGGGGGVLYSTSFAVSASPITVTVGGGGAGGADIFTAGTNGGNSVFSTLTAIGGGGGGGDAANLNGKTGGSGGGSASEGSQSPNTGTPGSGTAGQGYAGGSAIEAAPNYGTGGGGGAGQAGANGTSTTGGKGGDGLAFSISGTSTYYGGGGGGGTYAGGTAGQGGLGGGGNGAAATGAGQNGTNGTGGGGGGSGQKTNGYFSNGGSGIVIIRYSTSSGNINSYQTSSKLSYAINTPLFSQLSASATASAVGAYSLRAINGTTAKAVNVSRGPSGTYPPSALSSTAMTGQTVSGITYTVSSSSTAAGPATPNGWNAFDKVVGNYTTGYWQSAYNYNTSTGVYQGSASLGGYSGEWLKLQLSVSIQLTSYSIEPRSDSYGPLQTPLAWYILGSTDGSTWAVVDSRTGITWTAGVAQTFYPTNKNTYSYFAIVCSYVAPTNTYGSTSISEWILYNTGTDFYTDRLGNLLTTPVTGQTLSDWLGGSTGYVTTWYDQSGLGNHMSCSSTSIQPKIDPVNKWIDFKTTAYFDTSANPTTGPVPYSNTKNYTVVCRHNTIGNNSGGICGVSNAAPSYNASNFTNNFRRNTTNYQNYWFFNDVNGGTYAAGNSVTFKWDGTNRYIYSNGTLITTQASSNWLQTSSSGQMIGKTTNDTTMNGEMYYLIMFTTALSDADRQLVEALPIS